ncbi:MAG: hypothetical protein QM817_13445 [Archangium sp.]
MLSVLVLGLVAATAVEESVEPPASLDRHFEVQLIPTTAQINTLTTEHFGTLARVSWRVNPWFAFYVGGGFNWLNRPSPGMDALQSVYRIGTFRLDLVNPSPVQQTWQSFVGVETVPIRGRHSLFGLRDGDFGIAIFAGIGPGGSRVRLKPETVRQDGTPGAATFGEAGVRLLGHLGGAVRVGFGPFVLSLGLRASLWADRTNAINGCNGADLRAMDAQIRMGNDPSVATVSTSCSGFEPNDVGLALNVIRVPVETVSVNLAGELGLSWSFF